MIPELYIENQQADITTAMSSLMTFAIDDISDFSARSTAYSKTIVLPGSLRNNILFGNIFEVAISNSYDPALANVNINFNASALATCLLFQDFIQVFKGTIRILQINIDRGKIEYEVAISGEITKLNSVLTTALLEDLDFSTYDHVFNETAVTDSWDTEGSGVYYPLIDYGTYSVNKHDWLIGTFRPALYVKEYIDKIFEAANFRYDSDLFETTRFKRLIIPHNQKELRSQTTAVLVASQDTTQTVINTSLGDTSNFVDWDNHLDGNFTYSGGQWTYSDPTSIVVNFTWYLQGQRKAVTVPAGFSIEIRVNGVAIASQSFTIPPGGVFVNYNWVSTFEGITINNGDTVDVFYQYSGFGTGVEVNIQNGSYFRLDTSTPSYVPVTYGQNVTVNDAIPKNIKQIDFLVSIVKLFNLYVYEDKNDERLLHITPYVDFYSEESQNAVDWTYKLDRNSVVKVQPLSEINAKVYNFKYASDSDYYNDLYTKRYNQTYGSFIFDTEFDFVSSSEDLELIFASTPLVGYGGEEKVYPTIFKLSDDAEETIDSVIRIMQTKKVTGVASWDIMNGVTVLDSVTDYGYAGHFDDPDNVTNDLNFGAPNELFFVLVSGDLTVTQFNIYWSAYMAEITDKDSKLLSGKFYLQPKDILELDFSKYVNVDGNLFRLNKIKDYNLTRPDLAMCELLKVINTLY